MCKHSNWKEMRREERQASGGRGGAYSRRGERRASGGRGRHELHAWGAVGQWRPRRRRPPAVGSGGLAVAEAEATSRRGIS
jgi:hypothetical protein